LKLPKAELIVYHYIITPGELVVMDFWEALKWPLSLKLMRPGMQLPLP
jgi:hypothetical protein